jgi:hypothetical protein
VSHTPVPSLKSDSLFNSIPDTCALKDRPTLLSQQTLTCHHATRPGCQLSLKHRLILDAPSRLTGPTQPLTRAPDLLKAYHQRRPLEHIKAALLQSSILTPPHWISPAMRYLHSTSSLSYPELPSLHITRNECSPGTPFQSFCKNLDNTYRKLDDTRYPETYQELADSAHFSLPPPAS